jgi:hypothetical protein
MPMTLPERHLAAWLGAGELVPLLRPYPSDALRAYRAGRS